MPYATGQTPEVGDYVKNQWEQPGTVIRVSMTSTEDELVSIRWDDGGRNLLPTPATEFTLISRLTGTGLRPE
jgi:hypothetical protein